MSMRQLAEMVEEELAARKWTPRTLAIRIWMEQVQIEELAIELLLGLRDEPNTLISDDDCARLDRAFGISGGVCRRIADAPEIASAVDAVARSGERVTD